MPHPLIYVGFSALLLLRCSTADMCEPGDPCVGFSYTNYRGVLNHACEEACAELAECGGTLAKTPNGDCEAACRAPAAEDYYWTCEPRYREMLSCLSDRSDCDPAACEAETQSFDSCRTQTLPANANSCVFANNGTCDEPARCVAGSDTTDCAGTR